MENKSITPKDEKETPEGQPFVKGEEVLKKMSFFTTPLSARGWPIWLIYALAVIGLIYILNPTAGLLEFIPDNFPIIGNLDEGIAFLLVWEGLVEFFEGKNYRTDNKE